MAGIFVLYSKTTFPCGVFSCIPSGVGVSAYDAKPSQACTVQTSVQKINIERPVLQRAALNIPTYRVTSVSKTCKVFYSQPILFGRPLSFTCDKLHASEHELPNYAANGPAIWLDVLGIDLSRRGQYAPVDIVVNCICRRPIKCDQSDNSAHSFGTLDRAETID